MADEGSAADFLSDDTTDTSVWTIVGDPPVVDDDHNPASAHDLNGVDEFLVTTTIQPVSATSTKLTWSFWTESTATAGIAFKCGNADSVAGFIFNINVASGDILAAIYNGTNTSSDAVFSVASTEALDGVRHHVGVVAEATSGGNATVKIYIDGPEASYSSQNTKIGAGFTQTNGGGESTNRVALGARYRAGTTTNFVPGVFNRPRIWDNVGKTTAQMLAVFDNEVAAKGEGFDATGNIAGTISTSIVSTKIVANNIIT